jgi:hemin uptake protein HemP
LQNYRLLTYAVNNMLRILRRGEAFEQHSPKDRFRMPVRDEPRPGQTEDASPTGQRLRRVKVSELLAGEREAILEHSGQEYRLRITASGKLILTK